jgi:hypothetical protein
VIKRSRLVLLATTSLAAGSASAALVACGGAQPPPPEAPYVVDPTQITKPIPGDGVDFGCDGNFVVCVDACTGDIVGRPKHRPVAEGQEIVIRNIGWATCRPQQVSCNVANVPSIDVGYRGGNVETPADGGGAPPTPPSNTLPDDDTFDTAAGSRALGTLLQGISNTDAGTPKARVGIAGTKVIDAGAAPPNDQVREIVHYAQGAVQAHEGKHGRLGAARLLTAAAQDVARGSRSCNDARDMATQDAALQKHGLEEYAKYAALLGRFGATLSSTVGAAQSAVATYKQAAAEACSGLQQTADAGATQPAGGTPDAGTDASADAGTALDAGDAGPITDASTNPVSVGTAPLERVDRAASSANTALDAVIKAANAAATTASRAQAYATRMQEVVSFGDCVIKVPTGLSNRQIVVDVKDTPVDCAEQPTNASCPAAPPEGDAEPPDATPPPASDAGRATRDTLVYVDIDHGKYYWDVGLVLAVVPEGQRSVTTGPAPGLPGTNLIVLDERASTLTAIGVNVYPWGHRRQAYSFLEDGPRLGDLLGLQLAFNTDLKQLTSTLFGGIVVEPVTGLSLNAGVVVLDGDFLKGGYAVGMAAPADRSDYVSTTPMMRFYFGATVGYELFHTTVTQLSSFQSDVGH